MTQTKRSAAEMFPLMESYLSSEATQKEFAFQNGMSVAVLNYWLARYRRQTAETGAFLEIRPTVSAPESPLLEVCYAGGTRLRIFAPLTPAYLDHLLSL